MLEISPVLAGTFDSPDYAPASVNFTSGGASSPDASASSVSDSGAVDPRRYTKFDRTASNVGTASLSFGDFLDMLNPLQHIPVVGPLYRMATGDTINPVSRVVGDILYGGAFGLVTGLAGGVGAVADSVMEAKNGDDVKGSIVASLFGDEKTAAGDGATQSAAETPADAPTAAAFQVAAQVEAAPVTPPSAAVPSAAPPTQAAQGIPLNRNKLPYGGVMAPVKSMQEQNMAMALASTAGGLRIGNTIYTNRLMNGPHPLPVASQASVTTVAPPTPVGEAPPAPIGALPSSAAEPALTPMTDAASPAASAALPNSPIPSALNDDALIMKALGLYRSVAGGAMSGGVSAGVNVMN